MKALQLLHINKRVLKNMNKKKNYNFVVGFIFVFLFQIADVQAQAIFKIGHDQISLQDQTRNNRLITAELYYPATDNGEQVPSVDGTFPLILFAHGYQQLYTDYHDIWEALVPDGYIIVFLTTEGGTTIDLDVYTQDIIFLLNDFLNGYLAKNAIVTGHLNGKSALMGHSTGGGASYLAQSIQPLGNTVVSLAALGKPYGTISGSSPIESTDQIKVSSLVLSGKEDCICPGNIHQQPIYDKLSSDTKAMVTIDFGDHCGFSDSSNCPIAEYISCGIFGQNPTMDNAEQMVMALQYITPWLDHFLKTKSGAWSIFQSLMVSNQDVDIVFKDGEETPSAPILQVDVTDLAVSLSWSTINNAEGYTLSYAPHPYKEPGTIKEVDMGGQTTLSAVLWHGASFYIAIQSYNNVDKSEYSNIELITIP